MRRLIPWSLVFLSMLAACGKERPPAGADRTLHEVRGIVRGVDFASRELQVEHEEIPGYMPAMTMPFPVKDMREVESLRVGDQVTFQLVVTKDDSWITGVKRIASSDVGAAAEKRSPTGNAKVARLKEGDTLPDFTLVDDQARTITRADFAGKPLVLTFIFTRCPLPNYCPLMSNNLGAIRRAVADDAKLKDELRFLSVSFDPEYDTPEVLAQYAARFTGDHEQWRFATGTAEQIEKLTTAFSIPVRREGASIDHGLATALVGPDGVIRKIWRSNGWKPEEVVEELRKL